MMRHPGVSLVVALIVISLSALSAIMPIVLVMATGGLIAVLSNRVVVEELAAHQAGSKSAARRARSNDG